MTDHERWVSLSAAHARGEELTRDELDFVDAWSQLEDREGVEASLWRAVGRLGDEPLSGERPDADLRAAVLSAAIDLDDETTASAEDATPTPLRSPPTTPGNRSGPRSPSSTSTTGTGLGRRAAVLQFVGGFGGVLGAAALAVVLVGPRVSAGTPQASADVASREPASMVDKAPSSAVVAPELESADTAASRRAQADEASLGCVRLGAGAQACPASDDAQLEIGAPLGDRLALSLTAGTLRVSPARSGQASPRGSLVNTPLGTLDADGNASYEAKLTHEPVVLILVVHQGRVEVTEPDGDTRVIESGQTELIDGREHGESSRSNRRASADAMLGRAQTLLVEGEEQAAIKAYRALLASHRGTAEARAATLTLARLELERGQAKRALSLFERYLAQGDRGALGETARVGEIESLRRLGRAARELEAIERFLETRSQSIYAGSLRERRDVLRAQRDEE